MQVIETKEIYIEGKNTSKPEDEVSFCGEISHETVAPSKNGALYDNDEARFFITNWTMNIMRKSWRCQSKVLLEEQEVRNKHWWELKILVIRTIQGIGQFLVTVKWSLNNLQS